MLLTESHQAAFKMRAKLADPTQTYYKRQLRYNYKKLM